MDEKTKNNDEKIETEIPVKGINLTVTEFEQVILKNIQIAKLPVSIVRLVLNSVLLKISESENIQLQRETIEFQNAMQKQQEKSMKGENENGKENM